MQNFLEFETCKIEEGKIERLFASFKGSDGTNTGVYDPEDPESYAHYIQALIDDSPEATKATFSPAIGTMRRNITTGCCRASTTTTISIPTRRLSRTPTRLTRRFPSMRQERSIGGVRFDRCSRRCDDDAAEPDPAVRCE